MDKKLTIGIDLDGVIRDLLPSMCEVYNRKYNDNISPSDIFDFDVSKVFTKCGNNAFHFLFVENGDFVFMKSKPFKGSLEAIKMLRENRYRVIIVTNQTDLESRKNALDWLYSNSIDYDGIFFTHDKYIAKVDVLVDDKLENLYEVKKYTDAIPICITAPYNINDKDIVRFNNLYDFACNFIKNNK